MRFYQNKKQFYNSKEFYDFKTMLMHKRLNENGELCCEECGKILLHRYDTIPHHNKIPLTDENVNDRSISLSEDNIQIVCFQCHNKIEKRFCSFQRNVYFVHGSMCSGKNTWIEKNADSESLILDMDKIWQMISINEKYKKPNRLKPVVFAIRECIFEQIKMRNGKWSDCYILSTEPFVMNRKRLYDTLGVTEIIHIDTDKQTCLERLTKNPEGRNIEEWSKYIDDYFTNFQPDELLDV